MGRRLTFLSAPAPARPRATLAYEAAVGLLGWGGLIATTVATQHRLEVAPALLFLALAVGLKLEGFRVAHLVTHSLGGVAVLAALLALGPSDGAWVATLSELAFIAVCVRRKDGYLRPALFSGGLNALVLLAAAQTYTLTGGVWAPADLHWHDLPPLLALCLTWFIGDHLGWSLRIALAEGSAGLGRFLRAIRVYSLAVELLPLPLAAVMAIVYRALAPLAFALLALFLLAVGELLRRLNLTLVRTRERVADLTTLNAFSRALLASKLDVQALCGLLQSHTAAVLGPQRFWLGLFDAQHRYMETTLAAGGATAPDPQLIDWARKGPFPLLVRDAEHDLLPFTPAAGKRHFRSALWAPLQAAGETIGLLAVESDLPNAYSSDDLRTITTFANQTAIAIQNARSYEAEQRRARQVATVGEVSRQVVAMMGMEQLFSRVVTVIRDAFSYYHVEIFTVDPASQQIRFRASTSPLINARGIQVAPGQGLIGWVGQTGEAIVINDVDAEPRYRLIEGLEATRSEAVVPLKVDERLVGILDVQSERPNTFGSEDLFVLQTLADQVAIAIEDNRLYQAEKARRQLADTLREMATALNSVLELPAVLGLVLAQLQRVIPCDAAAILEWREGHFYTMAGRGARYESPDQLLPLESDERLRRLTSEPAPFVYAKEGQEITSLAAALRVKDRLIGALIVESAAGAPYGPPEMQVVAAFASQAAVAIENARLYAAQQEQAWVSTALVQVAETLANLIGLDEVLDAANRLVPLLAGTDRSFIFLRDEDSGEFRALRAHGMGVARREVLLAQPLRAVAPALAEALERNGSVLELGPDSEPGREAQAALGLAAGIVIPLRAGGEAIGALAAGYTEPQQLSSTRRAILSGIANQAAMAIQNAHLYIAQREEAWVSTVLLQVAELAGRTKDLDEILSGVVRLTAMLTGVDRACVFLWDGARGRYTLSHAYGLSEALREYLYGLELAVGDFPLLDRVRESGAPLVAEGAGVPELVSPALAEALDIRSALGLPLRSQDTVQGIMVVDYAGQAHHFPPRRIALLAGLTNQAGIAIENVRLYRQSLERERMAQELQVARRIQATFLPECCPEIPGWTIAALSQPAREVSGDFYDFFPLPAHRLGLVIADVSDKGVPAALFMALSRNVMRAIAGEGRPPAATLGRVNDLLLADSRSGMFVTLFYGILDTETGDLALASAGHNPAYLRRANGQLERLLCRGIALGVIERPAFEERRVRLEPGDALVLYTDGLTESFDGEEHEFGEEGLQAALRAAPATSAEDLMEATTLAVRRFVRGAPQADDLTMLVAARDA